MANSPPSSKNQLDEEDYIDIEVNSYYSYISSPSTISSPQNREFEFQMASITNDKKTTTSPADELFFKGKLLPLHQKILPTYSIEEDEEESFCMNFFITSNSNSPTRPCNISTSEYCRVSFELNPNESTSSIDDNNSSPKKLWSKKLKLFKSSLVNQKIKASREFLKSLFTKYSCKKTPLKNNGMCGASPTLSSIIKNIDRADEDNNVNNYIRSFSTAAEIKWNSPTKSLSSSCGGSTSFSSSNCSFNSNNGFYDLSLLKRSNSFTSEMSSIEAAIAHCKKI
ncbi:PREDICTED: probable membrane-associated kinase regulator 4 [Nicotiana attenuata]|uniref:Membrane-associated kinase regulator 4 n=1 Tax=Nicotiana attenuata TaxID=49451 RepID=A0A314LDZ1_NICAT|nr:PREDICTED: probable membrane-associated kinase regulator 4 [Nicotiana attenuata]OIT39377.1 putative membrane-associated kinase regulator 4 [Nicotiana attenuata]